MVTMHVPHRMIERAVHRFELESQQARPPARLVPIPAAPYPSGRVITISRQLGSGGRKVAELLSTRLGWQVWDKRILDALATESSRPLQARLFEALDEKGRGEVEVVMASLFGHISDFSYHYLLPKAILTIAQQDAIIVSRGAHLYLPQALKVRIVAPDSVRVTNLIQYEEMDAPTARRRLRESDREREAFRRSIERHLRRTRSVVTGELEYDLTLNMSIFSIEEAARLVLQAAEVRFALPTAAE